MAEHLIFQLSATLGAMGDLAPVFTLFLGCKSCPSAAPLDPQIVEADSLKAALRLRLGARGRQMQMASDDRPEAPRHVTRHDRASNRRAWRFAPRQVAMLPVDFDGLTLVLFRRDWG